MIFCCILLFTVFFCFYDDWIDSTSHLVTCPAPIVPEFAVPPTQSSFAYGDVFTFQCETGYNLLGALSVECGSDGIFGNADTTCTLGLQPPKLRKLF